VAADWVWGGIVWDIRVVWGECILPGGWMYMWEGA
jgi:hypothetical protein